MKTLSFLLCFAALLAGTTNAQADWGRPGPGHGPGHGGRGPGWDRGGHHGPRGPGWDRGRDRHDHRFPPMKRWRPVGEACGPQQPWGVSMMCPNMSPNGGPSGMPCGHLPRGTRCYGASYWHSSYVCTNPYNGQNAYGSFVFNMYVCD